LGAALHGADIDKLGIDRGHRILTILRKGGKIATIPLAPRTTRAIDLAVAISMTASPTCSAASTAHRQPVP
jgi:hypothetical protein